MIQSVATNRDFFSGLVHDRFPKEILVGGPPMEAYIVGLLEEFTVAERLYVILDSRGRRIFTLDHLLLDSDHINGTAPSFEYERMRRKFIGDLILFFMGAFPEGIKRHPLLNPCSLTALESVAAKNYLIASTFDESENVQEAATLSLLSRHFTLCAFGISYMRSELGARNLAFNKRMQ